MSTITMNLYYTGKHGAARRFASEMEASGTAAAIRAEPGNLRYEYFLPFSDPETILLIDSWRDQAALDAHHASPMMAKASVIAGASLWPTSVNSIWRGCRRKSWAPTRSSSSLI